MLSVDRCQDPAVILTILGVCIQFVDLGLFQQRSFCHFTAGQLLCEPVGDPAPSQTEATLNSGFQLPQPFTSTATNLPVPLKSFSCREVFALGRIPVGFWSDKTNCGTYYCCGNYNLCCKIGI